jgi:hypothetical protein
VYFFIYFFVFLFSLLSFVSDLRESSGTAVDCVSVFVVACVCMCVSTPLFTVAFCEVSELAAGLLAAAASRPALAALLVHLIECAGDSDNSAGHA